MKLCRNRHLEEPLTSHRPAVTSETGTEMDAAEVLANQLAGGE